MPEWGDKPDKALADALHVVLEDLEDEVADNPTFDAVTGVPLDKMTEHATEAIGQVFGRKIELTREDLVQCYAMGFVIGMKFSEYQRVHAHGDG